VPLHSLAVTAGDVTIARIIPEPAEPWVFRLTGLKTGVTTIVVKLMVNGEAEFTSHPITIRIQ
jgi:hypothetical protein